MVKNQWLRDVIWGHAILNSPMNPTIPYGKPLHEVVKQSLKIECV